MIPNFINKESIPNRPGIYQYFDNNNQLLYVGKAVDLYSRVSSYFNQSQKDPKTENLVSKIAFLKTIEVHSEIEALILEANLIKLYKPSFNIKLTDDKDYLYIKVTKTAYPKILTARKNDLGDSIVYFGPFPSSSTVKSTLKKLRRVFPWCSNPPKHNVVSLKPTTSRENSVIAKTRFRPCFYYHLNLCSGVCIGQVNQLQYRKNINLFITFMNGKHQLLLKKLNKQMQSLSSKQHYEQAAQIKNTIDGIEYLLQSSQVSNFLEDPNFLQHQKNDSLISLKIDLGLKALPERIECYDVSHISGKLATGSLVVITNGEIDKKWYRKFKIKSKSSTDDVARIKEIIGRRIHHSEWPTPDLVLVDGGLGQSNAAYNKMVEMEWDRPIFGLAKRREWLYSPDGKIIKLSRSSPSLRVLLLIRDEAHRTAITYHKKLRSKLFFQ